MKIKPNLKCFKLLKHVYLLFLCFACVNPYDVTSGEEGKLLIVDGLITNEKGPYKINLNYSSPTVSSLNNEVSDAEVSIVDDRGGEIKLSYVGNGNYITPNSFRAIIGHSYKLLVKIGASTYESPMCLLNEPSCIDSISYRKKESLSNDNEKNEVLEFVIDASICSEEEICLRWEVKEDWEIYLRLPEYLEMLDDSTFKMRENVDTKCYKSERIERIMIHSFKNQNNRELKGLGITSINPSSTDRIVRRYRAIINQYSISQDEFLFWRKLKDSTEDQDDFFGKQPYKVLGNIVCVSNPKENVLGYFQVAGVTKREIYIDIGDLKKYNFAPYRFETCLLDTIEISDEYSLYDRYKINNVGSKWRFYKPYYSDNGEELWGIIFTSSICANCAINGANSNPPKDWIN